MKKGFFIAVLALLPSFLQAQNARLKYADRMFDEMAYFEASEAYQDVLERGVDSARVSSKMIQCSEYLKNGLEEEWYSYKERNNSLTKEELLKYALIRWNRGDILGAKKLANQYEKTHGITEITKFIFEGEQQLKELRKPSKIFQLKTTGLKTNKSEMNSGYLDAQTLFVSKAANRKSMDPSKPSLHSRRAYDLYTAKVESDGELGKLKPIKGKLNSNFHDGPACIDPNTNLLYFTRNNYFEGKKGMDKNHVIRLKIYRGELDGNKLKNVVELPFNSDDYSCAHPAISADGKTLYFASDKPGGMGKTDLYRVALGENGTIGAPENLGETVNTSQNELFPTVSPKEGVLYFSSNGHLGLGALDIYGAIVEKDGSISEIINVGAPVNSTKDDFSLVLDQKEQTGFFTSNRSGKEQEDDIYSFQKTGPLKAPILIKGLLTDRYTSKTVPRATVILKDADGNEIMRTVSDENGAYTLPVKKEESYQVEVIGDEFDPASAVFTTHNWGEKESEVLDIELNKRGNFVLAGTLIDSESNEPIDGATITVKNNDNKEVQTYTTSSKGDFDHLLDNKFGDEINYDIVTEKDGYLPKTLTYTTRLEKGGVHSINDDDAFDFSLVKIA